MTRVMPDSLPDSTEPTANAAFSAVGRPERWDQPFGEPIDDDTLQDLLQRPPFCSMDGLAFPQRLPMDGILRNDCRIRRLEAGEILMRAGDYGNSAFLVLEGAVRVMVDALPPEALGRGKTRRKSLLEAVGQLWNRSRVAEVRQIGARPSMALTEQNLRKIPLADIPGLLDQRRSVVLGEGELFGEIAALGRTPRTSTVIAEGPARLLEIRWQGLREFRRYDSGWKQHLDRLYRERSLMAQLSEFDWFKRLPADVAAEVAAAVRFETHGRFDWHGSYRALRKRGGADILAQEPVILQQGDYLNGLVIVRSGFARLSGRYNHGERTISYLGKGEVFGLAEFARHRLRGSQVVAALTLRAIGYVDVLMVPAPVVEQHILPALDQASLVALAERLEASLRLLDGGGSDLPAVASTGVAHERHSALLEFMVEGRYINGTASMVIDLERCTRCDDCVRACAAAHDGNPRFVRHGAVHDGLMVAHACMHCMDPVCMIGCPTGAIHRNPDGGQVLINDQTCVGCATCANSCPYENIQMVAVRDPEGKPWVDESSRQPILKATKCDLCVDQMGGPACERACPHDALARIPLHDPDALVRWLTR